MSQSSRYRRLASRCRRMVPKLSECRARVARKYAVRLETLARMATFARLKVRTVKVLRSHKFSLRG